jgi:dimeric dUTPase (all-alpha-NTP-PPase superfamily)
MIYLVPYVVVIPVILSHHCITVYMHNDNISLNCYDSFVSVFRNISAFVTENSETFWRNILTVHSQYRQ